MSSSRIVRSTSANIRDAWPREDRDFTPWIAANLDVLDDVGLGPLTLEEVEKAVPGTDRSLDVLASTNDGRLVAIENQYGRGDHDHFTRGLAYAVGLEATALVIIAEDHRPEFRAIADYLNGLREKLGDDDGIAVFLVVVTVEQVGDSFVPRFSTCTEPNEWRASVQESLPRTVLTVDEFLAKSDSRYRAAHAALIAAWAARAGCKVVPQKATVGLRAVGMRQSARPRSAFTLEHDGRVWLNVGLFRELDTYESDEGLRATILRHLPTAESTGKDVWWKVVGPQPEAVLALADELLAPSELDGREVPDAD